MSDQPFLRATRLPSLNEPLYRISKVYALTMAATAIGAGVLAGTLTQFPSQGEVAESIQWTILSIAIWSFPASVLYFLRNAYSSMLFFFTRYLSFIQND